ncbi:MAG: DUF2785 domain-containing protein [Vicinamibacterales bacterium]
MSIHVRLVAALVAGLFVVPAGAQNRSREDWISLAKSGFAVPPGQTAAGLLVEMNPLLASPDPVLRDEVAYSAAERWILRDQLVPPDDLRRLLALWSANLDVGLGNAGDDRVFGRSFSALCLSLLAARDVSAPFLGPDEFRRVLDRLLDYFVRERDLRGFDPTRGWMHAPAHTADALKFLARSTHFTAADLPRLLEAVRSRLVTTDAVFAWGENDRIAWALHAAVRRPDADATAIESWAARWTEDHQALWANGPLVDPVRFARVENAKQVLRSLVAILSMEQTPTPTGESARRAAVAALARMR